MKKEVEMGEGVLKKVIKKNKKEIRIGKERIRENEIEEEEKWGVI